MIVRTPQSRPRDPGILFIMALFDYYCDVVNHSDVKTWSVNQGFIQDQIIASHTLVDTWMLTVKPVHKL